jgi:hypothetical protein
VRLLSHCWQRNAFAASLLLHVAWPAFLVEGIMRIYAHELQIGDKISDLTIVSIRTLPATDIYDEGIEAFYRRDDGKEGSFRCDCFKVLTISRS